MSSAGTKALFLHWGPGSNCGIERLWFGQSLTIDWWDQPVFAADDSKCFEKLVEAARARLLELHRLGGAPVPIIAHSFGAQLALELCLREPTRIASLRLLAASERTARAFVRLGQALEKKERLSKEMLPALRAAESDPSPGTLWPLIGGLAAIPDLLTHYFAPGSGQHAERYFGFAAKHAVLDPAAFGAILGSYWATGKGFAPAKGPSPFQGPVRLVFGEHDPLGDAAEEEREWRNHFPNARAQRVQAGHFVQFETPTATWFSAS